jgi:hypothetical protein
MDLSAMNLIFRFGNIFSLTPPSTRLKRNLPLHHKIRSFFVFTVLMINTLQYLPQEGVLQQAKYHASDHGRLDKHHRLPPQLLHIRNHKNLQADQVG